MDNLSEFYKAYGESLATRLTAFAHSDQRKTFVFVEDVDNPVEILSHTAQGKAVPDAPVLSWDNFDEDLNTSGRDNYFFAITGTFAVLYKTTDQAGKTRAYRDARALVLKTLTLMIEDAKGGSLLAESIKLEVRQFPLQKVGPISACWYGYGVQFVWHVPAELSLSAGDALTA